MQKCIFLFLVLSFFGFSLIGCGGGSGTGADVNVNTPVPTFNPVATATPTPPQQVTSKVFGAVYYKDKTTLYCDTNLVILAQSTNLTASGQTNYSVLAHVDTTGHFELNDVPQGDMYFHLYKNINAYNNNKLDFFGSTKGTINSPKINIVIVEGEFISGNPPPAPTAVPTVIPTTVPTSVPTAIPSPLPGCAGLVISVIDDNGATYENTTIKLEDMTNPVYRADFTFGVDWHRIYSPIVDTVTLDGKQKLDLPGGKTYNVLVFSSGVEMGSKVILTTVGKTEEVIIKIHSGSLYNLFLWFEFSNFFTTTTIDQSGQEICDPNSVYQVYTKITGDGGNYSKICLLSAHDYLSKWWQTNQMLYSGSYNIELWIQRSGAKMFGSSPQSFTINSNKNFHIWETSPLLSGAFHTYSPGDSGIDHSYGNITTSSGIKVLECPILPNGTTEVIPWAQDYNPGKQTFVSEAFDVLSEAVTTISTAYFMTVESIFGVSPSPKIWTNAYRQKKDFPQNTRKTIVIYNYANGTDDLRIYSKLFKGDGKFNYYSLTLGPADGIYLSSALEPYAPK